MENKNGGAPAHIVEVVVSYVPPIHNFLMVSLTYWWCEAF
jgi:hypothetical protein